VVVGQKRYVFYRRFLRTGASLKFLTFQKEASMPTFSPQRLLVIACAITTAVTIASRATVAEEAPNELETLRKEVQDLRRSDAEKQRRLDEISRKLDGLLSSTAASQPAKSQPASPLDQAIAELPPTPSGGIVVAPPPGGGASLPPTSPLPKDIFSRQAGGVNFRLIDISLDLLVGAGGSTVSDSALANLQGGGHDPRKNGFTIQNVELSLSGAIDPYVNGEAHIVYLIDPISGESRVELEEAFLTTQQLPYGLQLKAGQYFTEFGRMNPRHPHQWEFMDQPVINTRLFGPDGMRGAGARLSWLTPLPWHSEFLVGVQNANGETMASFLSSEELAEERPVGGRPFVERDGKSFNSMVYSARWENGFDLTKTWSAAVGVSGVMGPNSTGSDGRTLIYGTDLTLKWKPERNDRGYPYFIWQTEAMGRTYKADSVNTESAMLPSATLCDWGGYTQGVYGFAPGWRGGLRLEYASGSGESVGGRANDPFRDDRFRASPLVEWLPSEFSRVRFQVNYDRADHLASGEAFSFWVGFEFLIGAHSAHKY
jgi:hypothetical protein